MTLAHTRPIRLTRLLNFSFFSKERAEVEVVVVVLVVVIVVMVLVLLLVLVLVVVVAVVVDVAIVRKGKYLKEKEKNIKQKRSEVGNGEGDAREGEGEGGRSGGGRGDQIPGTKSIKIIRLPDAPFLHAFIGGCCQAKLGKGSVSILAYRQSPSPPSPPRQGETNTSHLNSLG